MNIIKLAFINLMALVMGVYATDIPEQDFTRPSLRVMVDSERLTHHGAMYVSDSPRSYWVITQEGELVQFQTEAVSQVYVPVRHFADMLGGQTDFEPTTRAVTVTYSDQAFMPRVRFVGNTAYMPATYLGDIFGHGVHHDPTLHILHIDRLGTGFDYTSVRNHLPNFDGYTADDLHWLSRIIFAEARGESFEGMVAVGSVVMNRVYHPSYPNTIHGVVFDRRNGIQFSPTANGAINNSPCLNSFMAALDVLEGHRNASDALFFMNPRIATTSWISRNRAYAFTLDNHTFFY